MTISKIKFLPVYLISILPFAVLYLLSDIIFVTIYYLMKYRRGVVRANLVGSFPDESLEEIIIIEKKFYRHFCDMYLESIKLLTMSEKSIEQRFKLKNKELIEQLYQDKKSIILYTAHYGNWEWLAFLPLSLSHKVTAFYQPLSNKYFDELINLVRTRFGVLCVESKTGFKTLLKFNEANILSLNMIVGDQSPPLYKNCHWTRFLHRETAFFKGAVEMAKRCNHVLVIPLWQKLKRGHYQVEFTIVDQLPGQAINHEFIDKYAQSLEGQILNSPELWLWSHNRWKLTKPVEASAA